MITKSYLNQLAYRIIGCAIEVHRHMGPGLLESVYEACMIEELTLQGIYVRSQVPVPLIYKEKILDKDFRMDLLVEHIFAVELKAVEIMHPVYKAQLLSHMKLAGIPKGLLINFNTVVIKNDLDSMVTELFAKLPE